MTTATTPILQAPALSGDATRDTDLPMHCRVERRIVWNLLNKLEAAGFKVVEVVDDEVTRCADKMAAMEAIFAVDDSYLFVRKGRRGKRWVKLVGGNGEDIISVYNAVDEDGFAERAAYFGDAPPWLGVDLRRAGERMLRSTLPRFCLRWDAVMTKNPPRLLALAAPGDPPDDGSAASWEPWCEDVLVCLGSADRPWQDVLADMVSGSA